MNYAVLDVETTGTNSGEDDLIQIGLVLMDEEFNVVKTLNSFVRPSVPIPPFITQLTGIDDAMVQDAPEPDDILLELIPLLDDSVLIGHNVSFDAGFLNMALDRAGYSPFTGRKLDTVEMLRLLFPSLSSYQLGAVSEHFGIRHDQHHRADSDAMATAILFSECVKKLRALPLLTLQHLAALVQEGDLAWFLSAELDARQLSTSLDMDSHKYFRQIAMKSRDWTEEEPPREDGTDNPLAQVGFEDFLEQVKTGFTELFPDYEEREAQTTMFREVNEAFENNRHLLIEAGTGTGKSLGYLIPSLYFGIKNERKIVISTHTINLQEQLRQRDLPLLREVLPFSFRASVFKGRGNYICLRKFETRLQTLELAATGDERMAATQMLVWLGETETGDQEEINFGNRGGEFWNTVSSDADSCLNRACPWFKRCFYHRAKQESNLADVVITNHSLLFTDIRADHRLLPGYEYLVIDEGHQLEEVAGKHLGQQLGFFSFLNLANRLAKDSRNGLLPQLRMQIQGEHADEVSKWTEQLDEVIPRFGSLKDTWEKLFELLQTLASPSAGAGSAEAAGQTIYRLKPGSLPKEWEMIEFEESLFFKEMNKVVKVLDKMSSDMKDKLDDLSLQGMITDLAGGVKDAGRIRDELRVFVRADKPEMVYWIEANANARTKSVQLHTVPADVSGQLKEYFFDSKKSVVITSATLTVQKTFQYAAEQLGLNVEDTRKARTVQLPSPFQYRSQALVMIPRDFPKVKGAVADPAYIERLVESLSAAANETGGRMLVLFTSYRMLKEVYDPLKEALLGTGIQVLGQGIDSSNRSKLTRLFRQQPASVLLGTSSFWEGVDIPGDALVCLAIVRLPFQPPNHPLQEAKAELLQESGQNPFMKLSVPQAVIRFKQGFGRLIRTSKDKGIVLIYDTRVIETFYGKHFLYSLPGPKIEHMYAEQFVPRMREWLQNESKEARQL
ncbi:ATP-dependent DNA helicase DinG [Paenibacillus pasadenensis]|uniref:ATP-dependent DNA helicase DinG n=1 Tax=Paenibacillus pasadenensis TaxID=217090 RepID=UPI00203E10CC|nr:ATP-dependent DNA helicase DinG [Paenibacillus pasadenensis]MCM3747507.1 ATP-dependent DNA helicase DinG [Paenibacillus pasadenensis]